MTVTSDNFNAKAPLPPHHYIFVEKTNEDDVALKLTNATIKVQTEDITLIDNASLTINKGDKVAFTGPNGSGKTSLFRVIRELWDRGAGLIEVAADFTDEKTLCASQEIRKTSTTLPGLLSYPKPPSQYTNEEYEAALREVDLEAAILHLPWNAVQPENIVRLTKGFIEKELEEYKGKVSPAAANDILKAFKKTMLDKFAMPLVLEDYMSDEQMEAIVDALTDYAATQLENDPKTEDILLLRSSRAGKIAAKKVAEQAKYAVDGWLLQGQRMTLSGGQQQKLVFARIMLQKPDFLLLDEVTSALKGETAHELYEKMITKLPDSTIISIIHNDALLKHHTHHMQLGSDKSLTVTPVNDAPKPKAGNDNAPKP